MIEELLSEFQDELISIQLTLSIGSLPTVHAIGRDNVLHVTEGSSLLDALNKMKEKILN